MAIRTVVTRGYGNGTFDGTIALVVLRGYAASVVSAVDLTLSSRSISFNLGNRDISLTLQSKS